MSAARRSSFVYVTIIRATPEKLWEALTDPKFIVISAVITRTT